VANSKIALELAIGIDRSAELSHERSGIFEREAGVARQNQVAPRRLIPWLLAGQDNSCWLRSSSRFGLLR
jgi:hypothetical protein